MKIGLTGGIAEGKSTILGYLQELGVATASADEVARDVFNLPDIQKALGELLGREPPVARSDLRTRLIADPHLRRSVNLLMHERVLRALLTSKAQVVEIPLLYETCIQGQFHQVWVVTCGPEEQLRRLAQRLGDVGQARELIATQLPTAVKEAFADHVFRTNRSEEDVKRIVTEVASSELSQ